MCRIGTAIDRGSHASPLSNNQGLRTVLKQLVPHKCVLDNLITRLDVDVVTAAECVVSPGWRLKFPGCGLRESITT